MLKFGIVTNIDAASAKVRVQFANDDMISFWLPVLQQKTHKDKYYLLPDIGEHVVCLMDENCEDGVLLGAIYSDADVVPSTDPKKSVCRFENQSLFEYDKSEDSLKIKCTKVIICADFEHEGNFKNSGTISSNGNISDFAGSMQIIRANCEAKH